MLIASHPDYMMAYGACTYIEDSTQQWVTAQTDRLLRSFVKHQPDRRMLELQAHPLPIPDQGGQLVCCHRLLICTPCPVTGGGFLLWR